MRVKSANTKEKGNLRPSYWLVNCISKEERNGILYNYKSAYILFDRDEKCTKENKSMQEWQTKWSFLAEYDPKVSRLKVIADINLRPYCYI